MSIRRRHLHMQRAALRGVERREIAERLGELQRAEREHFAGNWQIGARRRRDQHEHAGVRSALVQLSGRVQIPRSVAEHGGRLRAIAHGVSKCAELFGELGVRTEIGEERQVVAAPKQRQQRLGRAPVQFLSRRCAQRQGRPAVEAAIGWRDRQMTL